MAVTIVRMQAHQQTNNQNSVQFYVNFGEAVSNVSADDFALLGTGSATIGTPTPLSGDGPGVWIVPITATADGTFGLELKNGTDIVTTAGTLPVAGVSMQSGDFWTIDRTPPKVTSVTAPQNGTYRTGDELAFTVNFDEPVQYGGQWPFLTFSLDSSGSAYATLDALLSTSSSLTFTYTVRSTGLDLTGVTIVEMATNGTLTDLVGNAAVLTLNNVGSTANVLVDGRPYVKSIQRVGAEVTNATSASYTVTFDQSVTGVDAGDFVLTATGTADGVINNVTGSGGVYTVTVGSVSGDGTLRLDLKSSGTGIAASSGGAIASGFTSGQSYTLDHTAPAATSVIVPANSSYRAGSSLDFTVNFNEAVTVDTTNGTPALSLTLDIGGTRQATYVSGSGTSALVFRYTVQSGDADTNGVALGGSIALNSGTIRDTAGNAAALTLNNIGGLSGVLVDTTSPTNKAVSVVFSSDTGSNPSDLVTKTATQTVSGLLSATLAGGEHVEVSLNDGGSWATAIAAGTGWTLSGVVLTGSDTLQVRVVDAAGNPGEVFSRDYVLDTTAPSSSPQSVQISQDAGVSSSDLITSIAAQTLTGSLSVPLAAGEFVEVSLDNGGSWMAATTTGTSWSRDVTLSGSGTFRVRVNDLAGNGGAALAAAYVLDTTAPTTTGVAVAFSNDTGASGADLVTRAQGQTLSGTLSASLAAGEYVEVSLDDGASWDVASASTGSNTWSLAGVQLTQSDTLKVRVSDAAGNNGGAFEAAYIFDTVAPSVTVSTSQADLEPGQTANITFTFDENPQGFSVADVSVTGGSLSGFAPTANSRVYSAVFTASANTSSVAVVAGGYTDLAGNDGVSGSVNMAWTPPPAPEEPVLTGPQIRDIFTTVCGFALNSAKAITSNIVLPDGSSVPNPAFEAAARLASLIARFESGAITRDALIDGVVELSAPTSAVALQAYQFFTGRTPTQGGMTWLIDSPSNANDLTDPYYARFNEVNRFINFAVNLGVQGEGRAAFEAKFGALDFAASVRLAYDLVIGVEAARAAGINVDAALAWITSQEGYFDAFAGSDLGGKAAMIGYIMQAGYEAKVGRYYEATHDFIEFGLRRNAPLSC
ncbi:Ig-like domain-containing protein [Caulobacter sp. 73W]|uniref:Ig-like domain-containing protein n=1 Tax=Caulobacter sp. 73W TaxID=3161137 RepID=A0AB39KX85_9CAUL